MKLHEILNESGTPSMAKVKWKVDSAPTGRYRSFDHRGWPHASYAGDVPAASLSCEEDYSPARVREGTHGPLTLRVADHSETPWKWKKAKKTASTLDEAKKLFLQILAANPQLAPKPKKTEEPGTEKTDTNQQVTPLKNNS